MCDQCGCSKTGAVPPRHSGYDHEYDHHHEVRTVRIEADLLAKNELLAAGNRERFREAGVSVLNLLSSPGSGKTSLLERTLVEKGDTWKFAVLEGDLQTSRDAERIAVTGIPVRQINTGSGCHLDAHQVAHVIGVFDLTKIDLLMIENVGNLICPAGFDLGEDCKVVMLSVTEGDDKPLKYPHMFKVAQLLLINKIDLLPYVDFDSERCKTFARQINPQLEILELSCRSGEGLAAWYQWLAKNVGQKQRS